MGNGVLVVEIYIRLWLDKVMPYLWLMAFYSIHPFPNPDTPGVSAIYAAPLTPLAPPWPFLGSPNWQSQTGRVWVAGGLHFGVMAGGRRESDASHASHDAEKGPKGAYLRSRSRLGSTEQHEPEKGVGRDEKQARPDLRVSNASCLCFG